MSLKPAAALERATPSRKFLDQGHVETVEKRYGFRIGDLGLLLLDRRAQCEMVPAPKASRIPGTPDWLMGVMNLRGGLVPVFDLRLLFELPARANTGAPTGLVLDRGEYTAALITDGYPLALNALEALPDLPPLPAALRPYVPRAYKQSQEVWLEFDHRQLLASLAQRMTA
ncbi:MAG TPA: chemotaxis protein CheW [Steroidobacteraceae bacterium]|nr:chemotaxis protein CheW [Steroidobacteraceae bacterium]